MSVEEEIIDKVIVIGDPKEKERRQKIKNEEKKFLGRLKRKYRLMLIFTFGLFLILIFMILPMLIAVILQNQ